MTDSARTACPACGGAGEFLAHGLVAPFISELAGTASGVPCAYRSCTACGLRFFDARYTDRQMASIYSDYRGGRYVAVRRRWEPWYSAKVNDAYSDERAEVQERRAFIEGILTATGRSSSYGCVVDYGGDEGQFFPSQATGDRLVCDISNRALLPGVRRIGALEELGDRRADLVIMAHLLEHLPEPATVVAAAKPWLAEDGFVYVEVPLDEPRVRRSHAGTAYRRYLDAVVRARWLFMLLDLVTGVARQWWSAVPAFGIVKQSEHINYFSPSSLRKTLEAAGFEVVAERADPRAKVGGIRIGRYGVAARVVRHAD